MVWGIVAGVLVLYILIGQVLLIKTYKDCSEYERIEIFGKPGNDRGIALVMLIIVVGLGWPFMIGK